MAEPTKIESAEQLTPVELYEREIVAAEKELDKFHSRGKIALKRYIDERDAGEEEASKMNLWWSDTNVLKSAIYSRQPKADVSRKNKDSDDDVGRVAGLMMERILNLDMESKTSPTALAFSQAVEDRLIPGLGQLWARYEPTTAPQVDPMTGQPMMNEMTGQPMMQITDEQVPIEHVHWEDFGWTPARTWNEVRRVWRKVYMTREELVKRFPAEGALVPLNTTTVGKESPLSKNDPWQKACVYEIWSKESRKVCWFVRGYQNLLDEQDDPLGLADFFPCPEPFAANLTTSSYVPKSDYTMLYDSYRELDIVQNRIVMLERALRVVGAYDKTQGTLKKMLGGLENEMVEVDNWAMFAEKGGLKGTVDWFPVEMVAAVLDTLMQKVKPQIIADLRELRGVSDIMRGETNANETLGAQQLKAQFGSVRLQFIQGDLARFVQQTLAIKAEIIAAKFQPDTIKRQSLSEFLKPADQEFVDPAIARLKDKRMAMYTMTVDPDTMAQVDYAAEQKSRTDCIQGVAQYITAVMPLVQMKPESVPFLLEVMQWYIAAFKGAQQIEGVFDQAINMLKAAPQGPDPMQQAERAAGLKKVQSEGDKNQSAAVKNIAEARVKGIEAVTGLVDALKPEPQPQFPQGGAA